MFIYPYSNKILCFISLIFIPLIIVIINLISFELNFYLYLILSLIISLFIFTKHNIKAWFWLSFFLIIYSFPHFIKYYLFGVDDMINNENLSYIINSSSYNLDSIRLLSSFILSLLLGNNLFSLLKKQPIIQNNIKEISYYNYPKTSSYKSFFLYSMMIFLFLYSISAIDFTVQSKGYSLGGFNILFGFCYILNFFIIYYYLSNKNNNKYLLLFLILYSIPLGYFGVRQVLFWLVIALLISYFLKTHIENKKINWIKILFSFGIIVIFFAIILVFRNQKEFDLNILSRTGEMVLFGLQAETTYTFYNMFSSIQISETNDLFFMKSFKDIFYYLIPRPIFPNKYEFITLYQFTKSHNLSPFGSSFYLGELKLSLRYDLLILIFGTVISFISEIFLSKTLKKNSILLLVLYVMFVVMVFIYPIRGTIGGGVKIFIQYNFLFYFILKNRFLIK